MAGKGSRRRRAEIERKVFEDNWDRIYGKAKKERTRELIRHQYSESDKLAERQNSHFQEGCLRYAEHSIQYSPPPENHR